MSQQGSVGLGFRKAVRDTAALHLLSAGAAGLGGLIIAKVLGATGRGDYAAAVALIWLVMVPAELGLPASMVFHVARYRARRAEYLTTGLRMALILGCLGTLIALVINPSLARGRPQVELAYVLIFLSIVPAFYGSLTCAALQGTNLRHWNRIRTIQPVLYLVAAIGFLLAGVHSLIFVAAAYLLSTVTQTVIARQHSRRLGLGGGKYGRDAARSLFKFGLVNSGASVSYLINTRIDQLFLAYVVSRSDLGQYALAVALATIAFPLTAAFGRVALPRLAGGVNDPGLTRYAVLSALGVGAIVTIPICVLAQLYLVRIFGSAFAMTPLLLWVLLPGAVALGVNQVFGDLFRGSGRPELALRAEGCAAVVTVVLLLTLVPRLGVTGAAVASTAAYLTAAVISLILRFGGAHEAQAGKLRSWRKSAKSWQSNLRLTVDCGRKRASGPQHPQAHEPGSPHVSSLRVPLVDFHSLGRNAA
jgi:O-antigen/teichoic acid export membrane protein